MIHDLFTLKTRLNCDLLTVEMGARTVTITAAPRGPDGRVQRLRKELPLEEMLAGEGDELEAVLVRMAEGYSWTSRWNVSKKRMGAG